VHEIEITAASLQCKLESLANNVELFYRYREIHPLHWNFTRNL